MLYIKVMLPLTVEATLLLACNFETTLVSVVGLHVESTFYSSSILEPSPLLSLMAYFGLLFLLSALFIYSSCFFLIHLPLEMVNLMPVQRAWALPRICSS